MRGETEREAFGAVEPVAGQREKLPHPPGQPRQIPSAADIGKQADAGFGHGEPGMLGRDPVATRQRDADAAAHRDAVHEGDHRLHIAEQLVVHPVFGVEERARRGPVLSTAFREHPDVAAGAEATPLGVVDQHRPDPDIDPPRLQRVQHRHAHRGIQRMDRSGSVEPDPADRPFTERNQLIGHDDRPSAAISASPRVRVNQK